MARLENSVGVRLLDRTTRVISLTDGGAGSIRKSRRC